MAKKKTRKQMGKASNSKGKAGEREAAHELSRLFKADCRRSQQYCGGAGDADVVGLVGVHIEVKRRETLNIDEALSKARGDMVVGRRLPEEYEVPLVLHRKNGERWKATVYLDDLPQLATQLYLILAANG